MFNVLLALISFINPFRPSFEKVSEDLLEKLYETSDREKLTVIILMNPSPDYEFIKKIPDIKSRADYLKTLASESQRDLLDFLSKNLNSEVEFYEPYWVYNGIRAKLTNRLIKELIKREDVLRIELEPKVFLIRPEKPDASYTFFDSKAAPWNMQMIKADSAWANNFRGEGVIVGAMDSGIDRTHPAFAGVQFKARAFTTDGNPFNDACQHGTHVSGTIIGGTGNFGTNDIGVAPNVPYFVMAKIFDNSCYAGNISAAFQWIASLKADSNINIRAVNNSWGSCYTTSTAYWQAVLSWRALEIFPVFSIGNNANCNTSCASTGTAGTPGNYPTLIGVGTVGTNGCHDCVGQRGPAPNQSPWNDPTYWFYPTWNLLKPDIAAPGSGVRSSVPGGGYATWDGSSMAAPHVTGALALLFQANPALTVDSAYMILINTTTKPTTCGYTYPNDRVGWGIVNVWKAIQTQLGRPIVTIASWDTSNTGQAWDPGEQAIFDFVAKNFGQAPAYSITGKLRTTSPYVTITDSTGSWPDLQPGQSANNTDNFSAISAPGTPIGTLVNFTLYIYGTDNSGNNYTWQYDFSIRVGALGATLTDIPAGNAILTVTNRGGFPSQDEFGNFGGGTGFKWPKTGSNHLYYGSIGITNSSTYVADAFYNANDAFDDDFAARDGLWWIRPAFKGDTLTRAGYDDSPHSSSKNIYITQYAYAFSKPTNPGPGNGVLVELNIINKGSTAVSGLYAGLFMDFDINPYSSNSGSKDLTRRLIYMYYGSIYTGVALVEPQVGFIGKFLHNPTYVYPSGRPTEAEKYQFLSGQIGLDQTDQAGDWTIVASYGPFNLLPNDTQRVVFAIVGGNSLTNLRQNVDSIMNRYTDIKEVIRDLKLSLSIFSYRGKDGLKVKFTLPYNSNVTLDLIDLSGRLVRSIESGKKDAGVYFINLRSEEIGKGVFFLKLKTDKESRVLKIFNY
ncbi:MAG: S8 family peptidase [Candidatus Hydrothermales bacterium]